MAEAPLRSRRDRECRGPKMGVTPRALPFRVFRKLLGGGGLAGARKDPREGGGGKEAEMALQTPWPGSQQPSVRSWHARSLRSIWQSLEAGGCAWET